jgi:hypothetical protein
MASIAFPYLRIRPDNVLADTWTIERGEHVSYLTERLEDWDPTEVLHLRRRIRLNFDQAALALGVPAGELVLRASLIFGTGGPRGERLRTVRESHLLTQASPEADFAVVLEGDELSERLTLKTMITLHETAPGAALSPARPGVELWHDVIRLGLEPEEPRFAIQVESFASVFRDTPHALWRLDWTPALIDRDMAGNVRLYVNADRREFVERVSAGDASTMNMMTAGVMEQLVSSVLAHDAAPDGDEAPTSIAATVGGWIEQAFPGQGAQGVRELVRRDPAAFSAGLATLAAEMGLADD